MIPKESQSFEIGSEGNLQGFDSYVTTRYMRSTRFLKLSDDDRFIVFLVVFVSQ